MLKYVEYESNITKKLMIGINVIKPTFSIKMSRITIYQYLILGYKMQIHSQGQMQRKCSSVMASG